MEFPFLLILLVLLFIPSFLMMRRQRKQQGELQAMQASLTPGDRVVTSAGIHGRISALTDTTVLLEVAPGVEITLERIAILRSVPDAATRPEPVLGEGVHEDEVRIDDPQRTRGDDHPENLR